LPLPWQWSALGKLVSLGDRESSLTKGGSRRGRNPAWVATPTRAGRRVPPVMGEASWPAALATTVRVADLVWRVALLRGQVAARPMEERGDQRSPGRVKVSARNSRGGIEIGEESLPMRKLPQ
jgi:hypothetical protein